MDKATQQKLEILHSEFRAFDKLQANRADRWRNIETESALLLSTIIKTQQSKKVLEIGTSNGYSTIWLADALKSTKGHLISVEIDASKSTEAFNNLKDFNLIEQVELKIIDALDFLKQNKESFNLILLDAERKFYIDYWPYLAHLILKKPGCLLVVDNVCSHPEDVADFIKQIENDTKFTTTILNIGAGLLLVTMY